jgi:GntR family transcriptional regulator / MocR family aminotransferase
MRIPLDRSGNAPLYAQIANFLRGAITSGRLPLQTRLPSARRLASDLGISRMTVESAYSGLEAEGLVRREVGSGTFVMPLVAPSFPEERETAPLPQWQQDLLERCEPWTRGSGAAGGETAAAAETIRFDVGSGDARRFPLEDLRQAMLSVLRGVGRDALGYGEARGYAPLRKTIAEILSVHGLEASPENVLITSGSQQGLALLAQLLLRPGDCVVVERPTYAAALGLFRAIGVRIVDVAVDREGMRVELLEPILQRYHPKLIYTIPNFQNPTGSCMSTSRRRALVSIAGRHNVPILEDDFVADLRYDGRSQPPLKAFDRSGGVVYVSTFSKMLMPGLRAGFVHAGGPVLELMGELKRLTDLATSSTIQRTLHSYVTVGRYEAHLRRSRRAYVKRRDAMAAAVERCFPAGTAFDLPGGGLFLWVELPPGYSASAILPRAEREGVSFAAGREFFATRGEGDRFMRLNFAASTPEEIAEGVRRLGKVIAQTGGGGRRGESCEAPDTSL